MTNEAANVSIEAVDQLPKQLRPSPLDPVVDRIVAEVKPGSGWHRIGSADPAKLRQRIAARGVKVSARRLGSDPLALYVKID